MRQPGIEQVVEVPDEEHQAYIANGYIYLGPVPEQFDEVKPIRKKRKQ